MWVIFDELGDSLVVRVEAVPQEAHQQDLAPTTRVTLFEKGWRPIQQTERMGL